MELIARRYDDLRAGEISADVADHFVADLGSAASTLRGALQNEMA
jgi:hypothetical protein